MDLFAIGDCEGEQYEMFHRAVQQICGSPEMDNMSISKGAGKNVSSNSCNTTMTDCDRVQQEWTTDCDQDHILPK